MHRAVSSVPNASSERAAWHKKNRILFAHRDALAEHTFVHFVILRRGQSDAHEWA
jgi:hypothetical protein